jgi:hypothetical protein
LICVPWARRHVCDVMDEGSSMDGGWADGQRGGRARDGRQKTERRVDDEQDDGGWSGCECEWVTVWVVWVVW